MKKVYCYDYITKELSIYSNFKEIAEIFKVSENTLRLHNFRKSLYLNRYLIRTENIMELDIKFHSPIIYQCVDLKTNKKFTAHTIPGMIAKIKTDYNICIRQDHICNCIRNNNIALKQFKFFKHKLKD